MLLCACVLSHIRLFATPWIINRQTPLFVEVSRQRYWSGLPFPSLGIFLTQGLNLCLLHWQAESLPLSHLGSPDAGITIPFFQMMKSRLKDIITCPRYQAS